MENKHVHYNIWYFIGALFVILLLQAWLAQQQLVETIPYSAFQEQLRDNKIASISIADSYIRGVLREPNAAGQTEIFTVRVDPDLADDLEGLDVTYTGIAEDTLVRQVASWLIPMVIFLFIWMYVFRRVAGGGGLGGFGGSMAIGKSKAKIQMETDIKVTFDDVAGVDEAKQELDEIVRFLKQPDAYGRLGAHVPKGVLLVGPPGCGKTLLARAVAGEAGVVFFSINGSEFVEMFVGVGAARVRDLFEQARQAAPCIIFIDELDALGRARGVIPVSGGSDEKEQTLNQLLAELDGFDPSSGVVLLAATNRPEILDQALLRAGRFDRQVLVDRPDKVGRQQILAIYLQRVTCGPDVDAEEIAALTAGFSGADLANLVNEAALMAARRDKKKVEMADVTRAIERLIAGLEKKHRLMSAHERKVIATHEAGHALVAQALPGTDPVHKISIIPRGIGALGYTIQRPTEDRYLMTRWELENKMAVLLGGRAAEMLVFGELSTGAADDLNKATDIARNMVMRYGMSPDLGHAIYVEDRPLFLDGASQRLDRSESHSEETAREIDVAVRDLVGAAFDTATATLKKHQKVLTSVAEALLAKETLTADELPVLRKEKVPA